MKRPVVFLAGFLWTSAVYAQPKALLSNQDALKLCERVVQLIESTGVAIPGLARAGAPVLENTRQSLLNLERSRVQNHAGLTYMFLTQARSYLALADSIPKPYPFPEPGPRQFAELRESLDRIGSHFQALLDQKESLLRNPDRDNLRRYAEANEKLGPPAADLPRVVFLGDSITDRWRLNEYFTGRDFVNRGIGGQITGEMLGRMKADVIDLKPRAVVVLGGTNDIARGVPLSTIENNLTMMAEVAEYHKIKPLFASTLPVSDYHKDTNPQNERGKERSPAAIVELNRWIQHFCYQHEYIYVDYYSAMLDAQGSLKADLADDGLHPNSMGYRIMAPIVLEAIGRVIATPAPVRPQRKKRLGVL
jgi:lysophospholipase L1-like esterase